MGPQDQNNTISAATSLPPTKLTALNARKFGGIMAAGPYIDGILTLDNSGLRFVDTGQREVFNYLPANLAHVSVDSTELTIKPAEQRRFVVSLNSAATNAEMGGGAAVGVTAAGGAVISKIQPAASPGMEAVTAAASAGTLVMDSKLEKLVKREDWLRELKALGYKTNDYNVKKATYAGFFIVLLVIIIIVVA